MFVEFTPSLQQYKPIMWLNDYWNLNMDYMPINNITLTFQPLSLAKWQMYSAQQMKNQLNPLAGMMGEEEDDQDQDLVKEALLETNMPFVISIVHSVLSFWLSRIIFSSGKKSKYG